MSKIVPLDPRRPEFGEERREGRKVVSLDFHIFSAVVGGKRSEETEFKTHPSLVENVPSDQSQTDLVDGSGIVSKPDSFLLVLPDDDLSLSRRQHLSSREDSIRGRGVSRGRVDSKGLGGGRGGES